MVSDPNTTIGFDPSTSGSTLNYVSTQEKIEVVVPTRVRLARRRVRRFDAAVACLQFVIAIVFARQLLSYLAIAEQTRDSRSAEGHFFHGYGDDFSVIVLQGLVSLNSIIAVVNFAVFLNGLFRFNSIRGGKLIHWCYIAFQLLSLLFYSGWVVLASRGEPVLWSSSCLASAAVLYLVTVGFVQIG